MESLVNGGVSFIISTSGRGFSYLCDGVGGRRARDLEVGGGGGREADPAVAMLPAEAESVALLGQVVAAPVVVVVSLGGAHVGAVEVLGAAVGGKEGAVARKLCHLDGERPSCGGGARPKVEHKVVAGFRGVHVHWKCWRIGTVKCSLTP